MRIAFTIISLYRYLASSGVRMVRRPRASSRAAPNFGVKD